jgi:hypothetical protein
MGFSLEWGGCMSDTKLPRDPFSSYLFGTLWAVQGPAGLLAPAGAGHSFKFAAADVVRFGKLRDLSKTAVQNFIQVRDGSIYRLAWRSQTRAGRKWIRIHVERCRCPSLTPVGGVGKRLQVLHWIRALAAADVPADELARAEPLLPGETAD